MTALKVGDRVHVEFDGTVSASPPTGLALFIDPDGHGSRAIIHRDLVTRLADPIGPEPRWLVGDAIIVTNNFGKYTLVNEGPLWVDHEGDEWSSEDVATEWACGYVTRLVPEVKP